MKLQLIRCALLLAWGISLTGCISTPEFRNSEGQVVPGSVATMETVHLGGVKQSVWFRGLSAEKPALILLHGGPGASENALFRHFNSELEQHFLVVYWDQRGAGRSFHNAIPPESMTIDRFVGDLDQLVQLVKRRFHKQRVFLLGHSWGTVLGTIYAAKYPENVFAYVGVAPIANALESDRLSYRFALEQAEKRQDRHEHRLLTEIGPPPYAGVDERLAVGRAVERFGGAFHAPLSTRSLIWAALRTDEANLVDLIKFGQGNSFSLRLLEVEFSSLRLDEQYVNFQVPVFFVLGRHDWHVPSVLAAKYFEKIEAPCKKLVWFEGSAHNPPFEEPIEFNALLIDKVLPLAERRCALPVRSSESGELIEVVSCKQFAGKKHDEGQVAVGRPTSPAISPAKTNNATDKWLGQWTGPECTFLPISRKGDRYEVKLQSLDELKIYEGMAAADKIEFKRDGNTESIRAGSGKETSMKLLLEKKDWLIIREGEKFCRG